MVKVRHCYNRVSVLTRIRARIVLRVRLSSGVCLFVYVCLCILHQSCLTITAGTANCPIFGGLPFGGSWGL